MEMKAYCFECGKNVECETFQEETKQMIKGLPVRFAMTYCRCKECGELASSHKIEALNQIAASDAYKEEAGLLTSKEIRAIRKKQGLTAVEFAKKLKLGEKTITRYENGGIQTPQIDQLIRDRTRQSSSEIVLVFTFDLKDDAWNGLGRGKEAYPNIWSKPMKLKEKGNGKRSFNRA